MKVTIPDQPGLKDTLMQVNRVSTGRVSLPALAGVKLTATDVGLILEATDLETSVRAVLNATVEDSGGGTVVPSKGFYDVVRTLGKDHPIHLSTIHTEEGKGGYDAGDAMHLRLQQGDTDLRLRALPLGDFPPLPEPGPDLTWTNVSDTIPYLKLLATACYQDDNGKLRCQGAYVDGRRICATDSYRLVRLALQRDTGLHALVPSNALYLMGQALDRGKWGAEHLEVAGDTGQTYWRVPGGRFRWVVRHIDADPLNYDKILKPSDDLPLRAEIPNAPLENALNRAAKLSKGQGKVPTLLQYDEETDPIVLTLTTAPPETGEISEVVPIYTESGLMPEQAFDSALLHELLKLAGHDSWTFCQYDRENEEGSWPRWKPARLESPPLTIIAMPQKV